MMTPSDGNIFRFTGPLWGESTGHRWITLTKASDTKLWCFLWSAPWINDWVNNREAGDLRRHRAHYDVIVMNLKIWWWWQLFALFCFQQLMTMLHCAAMNNHVEVIRFINDSLENFPFNEVEKVSFLNCYSLLCAHCKIAKICSWGAIW